jgi:peptide/nickel transport system substrate-binding protein
MEMEKKNIAITVLIIALVASGVGNIILALNMSTPAPLRENAYIRATSSGPHTLEICDAWDSASNDVLEQVVETLFFYDLNDVDLPMVMGLAESYYWASTTVLQIKLREGVLFHDGTPFNATAAKWNLDRLNYLINGTGLNTGTVAQTKSLWSFPDGVTPLINNTAVVGDYNITITLNGAYAPFMATLSYINSGMISPTFHQGDATSFIDLATGDLCGTGPFTYDSYTPNVEVRMSRWAGYWMKDEYGNPNVANFPTVIYAIYADASTAHQAFLSGAIDANAMASDQNIATYKTNPNIYVYDFTTVTGKPSLVYQYMGVNNHKYNETWRKVLAFATNYTYVIDELRLGNAFRSYTAISPGYGAAFNSSLPSDPRVVPDGGNVTIARQTMVSMGFGTGLALDNDAAWIAVAEGSSPFRTVRYTYNLGNTFRQDLGVAVTEWLKLVGCAVEDDGVIWDTFLDYLYDVGTGPDSGWDHLELYAIGWAPDYLEPYNMLDPLFNPMSGSNSAQVNDTVLNGLMASALTETDTVARDNIYKHIQTYMATTGFNHIPLYHSRVIGLCRGDIYGIPFNAMGALRIFPIYRGAYRT